MAVALKQQEQTKIRQRVSRRRRNYGRRLILCFSAALALIGPVAYVGVYAKITQNGFQRAKLVSDLKSAKTENEYLRAELRMLSNPDRLTVIARQSGMVQGNNIQVVNVPSSMSVAKAE